MQKEFPYSEEAEAAVLSTLFYYPEKIHEIDLKPEQFYKEYHQHIFTAMQSVESIDITTVGDWLENHKLLTQAKGMSYLVDLHDNTYSPASHLDEHVAIVKRDAKRREGMELGRAITVKAFESDDINEILSFANQGVLNLSLGLGDGELVPSRSVMGELAQDMKYWAENPLPYGGVRGLTTGFTSWDRMMNGMQPKDFVVITARPRIGKTALVITAAKRIAATGKKVAFFALEMTRKQLLARLLAAESQVSFKRIQRGISNNGNSSWYATKEDWQKFMKAGTELAKIDTLYIDEGAGLSSAQIKARASALARKIGGLDLIIVDTGNLVAEERMRGENFAQTESRKSQVLRNMAKDLNCVVWMTWQMNKGVESRSIQDRRPQLGDLRDTGGVEEHATDIIGLFREEVYNPQTLNKNVMELLALKRREDEGNTLCKIGFDPNHQRFYEITTRTIDPAYVV